MAEPGRRSTQTMLFMVPTDEHNFGARLAEDLGRQATWTAVPRYQQPESYHRCCLRRWMSSLGGRRLTYG
jgi:hypothetical protein